jgi:serine phosphatase RsbU (regulator of sigma subunit)
MPRMKLNLKLLLFFELVLLIAVGIMLMLVRAQMHRQIVRDMQRELGGIASTAALQLDGDLLKSIRTGNHQNTPTFARLRDVLARVRDANGLVAEHIYTFYRDGESQVRFGVMTHATPFVGDPYPLQPGMRHVFDRGEPNVTGLYVDQHGSWISAYAPVRDSSGAVVGLLEVDKAAHEYFTTYRYVTWLNVVIALVALGVSSAVGWHVLNRIVMRPMRAVHGGVRALARQDFRHRVQLRTRDEFQDLGDAMNVLSEQLNVARAVQAGFTPRQLPDHAGYRFAIHTQPCDTTAGDYVDAFALNEDRVSVLVADVTGHGIGPSLLMAACRSALRALSTTELQPAELIQRLDKLLAADLTDGRFITMIFGILESDGTFTFCNAGHGPALVLTRSGVAHLPSHRPPLGIEYDFADDEDAETVIKLQPGDRVLLASDGVSEATAPTGEQFGTDRMAAIVGDRALDAVQVVERHRVEMNQHCGSERRSDDVTLLCIDRVEEPVPHGMAVSAMREPL